ncbi:uncharacterized protein LOC124399435 isoform X2 [Silurus meridionalis]|uniref:uncharacterized protein LOC124399435 isoform X2 n=1 Tax=Silurus meridionalis TaxID=175797 RepID=UPI001EEAFE97|nr:uncharacterized protein LOC124399435 isoform X2 [Silurus meridionalis]
MPSARNGENSSTPQRPLHRPACRRSRLFRVTEKRNVSLTSRNASHVFQALIDILPVVYHSFPSKPQANTTLDVKDGRWMTLLLTDLRIGTIGVIALRTYDSSGPSTSGLFEACRDTSCGYTGRTLKDSVMEIPAGLSVCPLTDLCSLSNDSVWTPKVKRARPFSFERRVETVAPLFSTELPGLGGITHSITI